MYCVFGAQRMYGSCRRFNRLCLKQITSYHQFHSDPQIRTVRQKKLVQPGSYQIPNIFVPTKQFCNSVTLDDITFEHVSEETLESLTEFLDELVETEECPIDADVLYSTGVLTLNLGEVGTYVINKQSPNKQIWFSSPFSGPKRYDFNNGTWVYKHDGICLHDCLSDELSKIFKRNIDMSMLAYGKSNN
ncbi:frataxin, mitochondrial-like [Palaemon carinicauda]|uniref:frataxin, mitochondrial-like n=1 Tax=Palaemon carinicauda TaxID=392227 RepID=UPI0035B5F7B0